MEVLCNKNHQFTLHFLRLLATFAVRSFSSSEVYKAFSNSHAPCFHAVSSFILSIVKLPFRNKCVVKHRAGHVQAAQTLGRDGKQIVLQEEELAEEDDASKFHQNYN